MVSVKGEVDVIVAERDEAQKEVAHHLMQMDRFQEGKKIVNGKVEQLLQGRFDFQGEIEHIKSGKALRAQNKGTRIPAVSSSAVSVGAGVQVEVLQMSTLGVMTDVGNV